MSFRFRHFAPIMALALAACMPAKAPADALKAAVVMTAEAVEQADHVCAAVGTQRKDAALLTVCKDAYNIARPALVAAQYYVDIGDQRGLESSLCTGERALQSTATAIAATGTKLPPLVTEAINFAGSICGALHA